MSLVNSVIKMRDLEKESIILIRKSNEIKAKIHKLLFSWVKCHCFNVGYIAEAQLGVCDDGFYWYVDGDVIEINWNNSYKDGMYVSFNFNIPISFLEEEINETLKKIIKEQSNILEKKQRKEDFKEYYRLKEKLGK